MARIRLGGIKIIEGRSHLTSSSPSGENGLPFICHRLAAERINLALLTHLPDDNVAGSITSICTDTADSFSSYFHLKADQGNVVKLESEVNILSIFPHEQRPIVTGSLLGVMANRSIPVYGLAGSPSAVSILIPSADTGRVIDALFDVFDFPTYRSPYDWHAAYRGKEQVLKEIICSYQEEIIKIYNITEQHDLDLWHLSVPLSRLAGFSAALAAMDDAAIRLPFLVAQLHGEKNLCLAFCLAEARSTKAAQILALHLPDTALARHEAIAAFYLHGPHFGDRHGIANALIASMHNGQVAPLAVSCAISSISVAVRAEAFERAMRALGARFQIPPAKAK